MGKRRPTGRIAITASAVVVLVATVVAGVWAVGRLNVAVPADAAATVLAHTVMSGPITPDTTNEDDAEPIARSPIGQGCLDRIERPAGPLDLCWEAYRDPADGDPKKDYYRLRVYGSFGGETGTGVRWAVVKARLIGEPMDGAFVTWPGSTYDGPCEAASVGMAAGVSESTTMEELCGRTTAIETPGAGGWSLRVTWTCQTCLFADHDTRAIALYEFVGVPEGTVPAWEISADLGS
jgi:hypothetical protein